MKLTNNKILITDGGSGIGLGLTERFIQEGNTVIICGRREATLKEVKGKFPSVITKVCDLTNEEDRIMLYNWVTEEHSDLNVLVNNAGIQNWMNVYDKEFYTKSVNEVNTNVLAPIHLTTLFLNLKSLDTIINVTSGLAFVPRVDIPIYCATKAFFHSFTISLRYMLKLRNIEVIEMIPAALNTDLGGKGLHDEYPSVSEFINSMFQQMKEGKDELIFGLSETLAKATPEEIKMIFSKMNK